MSLPPTEPLPPAAPPKGAMATIFLIVLTDLMGFGIIIPLLPFYALRFKASDFQVAALFSVFSICQFIGSMVLGLISDRYGRRPVLILSQLGSVAGYVLLGVVTQYQWTNLSLALGLVYLSRIIDGFTGGNVSTAQAYISDVTPPKDRAKGMGMIGAAFGIGFALGPFIGGILGGNNEQSTAYPAYAAAALSFLAMTMTYFRLPEPTRHKPDAVENWLHPRRFLPFIRMFPLNAFIAVVFVSMAAFVMLEATVALFLKDTLHFGPRQLGYYFGFLGFIIVVVQGALIGRLTRALGEWFLAIAGALFVAVGMLGYVLLGYHPLLWLLLVAGAINACGRSLQTPTLFALISQSSDPREQGTVFGFNSGLSSIARFIGPAVAGIVYEHYKTGPYALSGSIMLLVCVFTVVLRVYRPEVASRSHLPIPQPVLAPE